MSKRKLFLGLLICGVLAGCTNNNNTGDIAGFTLNPGSLAAMKNMGVAKVATTLGRTGLSFATLKLAEFRCNGKVDSFEITVEDKPIACGEVRKQAAGN